MKNLVFNLRTAKAQAEGCAKVSRMAKVLTTLTLLLTLGVGQMWGWNPVYLIGDDANNWSTGKTDYVISNNADEGSCYFYFTKNKCFAVYITFYNEQAGPGSNQAEMGINTGSQKFYIWGNGENTHSAKYTGNSGIVEVHAKQKDNGDNQPWIWLTRPTIYIRHNWNNSGWSNQPMTDNNDGTYQYKGKYSGSSQTNVGPCSTCQSGSTTFKYFTVTPIGSPAQGNDCLFTYNSSGFKGFGSETQNTGTLTITKLCTITYNANGATSGDKPADQTDILYNTPTTVRNNSGSLAKTGYIFAGWNTKPDGTGTTYIAGEGSINPTDVTTTLYAKWTEITITDLSASPAYGTTGVKNMTVSFKTNVPRNAGYYYRIAEFGGVGTGTTGGGFHLNGQAINSGTAETLITTTSFPTIYFGTSGTYTSAVEIYISGIVQKRVTFTYTAGDYCTVSFDMQDRGDVVKPQNILSGNTATVPSPEPTATGYTFGGWYENPECTGSAFNFSTPITVSRTLYAKWTPKTTTVTLDQQSGTGGTANVTATYDAAMPAATMPKRDNYTFNGYFTGTEGSGTKYYNADGTSAKNWDIEDATKTLYAHWTEIKYEVTISVSNPSATRGTIDCSAAGWVTSNHGTAQIGNATEVSMIAGAPASGYTWGSWVLSGGVTLISGNLTDAKIVVKATSAGTATYTYAEDLSTEWKIIGQSPSDKANSPFSSWTYASSTNTMAKATGHSTESVAYATISVPAASVTGEYYEFKISNGTTHYGYGTNEGYYILFDKTKTDQSVYSNSNNDHALRFKPNVAGDYTFKIDYSNNQKTVSVTFPTAYTVTYSVVGTDDKSPGRVSTEPSISSGNYVIEGTEITFTATPNLGYKFVGWYNDAECTGAAVSTDASYTIASLSANTTLYAKFELMDIKINSDVNGVYPTPWSQYIMDHDPGSPAVYTYSTTLTTRVTEQGQAPFNSGYHFNFLDSNGELLYNYNGVQTPPTYSGSSIDGVRKTDDGNPTIQFGLTRKSDVTITLTLQEAAQPTVDIAADPYYDITYTAPSHGTYTIQVGNAAAVSTNTDARATTTITLANTPATGYHLDSWKVAKNEGNVEVSNNQFTMPAENVTVSAAFTANTYSVQFNGNGATDGSMANQDFTYDAAQKLTANAFTKTGYTFEGWATEAAGAVAYEDGQQVSKLTPANNGTFTLYAKWTPKSYTVTLDKQTSEEGYGGNEGTVANQTVKFDATPATVTGSMPTAKNGWAFMGFYSAKNGGGRQFINPSGIWVTTAGDTIRESKWVYDGNVTLYAYYKKAEITDLIFDAAVVAPSAEVGVTPKVDPTPDGTNSICWKLLYNNGNLYEPQPTFVPNPGEVGNKVTFNAPGTSGMYLVAAVLRTGNECNGGTKLDSVTYPFQVAGEHTVTIQYKCGDVTLQGSTSVTARPLEWSEEITPDEIFGYTFEKWVAGEGVSMTIDGETTIETGGETTGKAGTHAVQIKAIYDGKLIAQYTKKNIIYFKNTLEWSEVYVNLYPYAWWNKDKGAGNHSLADDKKNKQMTQIGETDIWYYEYGNTETTAYVSFTDRPQENHVGFAGKSGSDKVKVSYPTRPYATAAEDANYGFNAGTPMFVPTAGQTAQPWNKSGNDDLAEYYNKGYWRKYDPIQGETGYTLKVYNKTEDNGRTELKSIKFVESDVPGQIFKAVADLEAAGGYGIKFERDNSMLYTNQEGQLHRTGDVVVTEKQDANYRAIWIKATAAGDYTFAITINGDGKLCIQAEFPVAKNDYRVIYTDNDTWTKAHTLESWYHPSRIISAEENAVDTISFFVSKDHSPEFRIQRVNSIDEGTGAIEWTNVTNWTSCDDVDASGVYNFIFTQDGSKNISFTKKEPYTGNYYIRTDAAGSTKWDNYRAPDHLMTYSEYSKTYSDYTHYFVKFVRKGTNVKFVVANDYSPCISDTLIVSTYRGGDVAHVWDSDGVGHRAGDIQANANVRYMWDIRNNAVYRAYLAPAQSDGSNFLVLRGTDSDNLKDENGNPLRNASNSGQDGYNHKAPDHCIQFVDNENWIYEATVQVEPSSYVKLYAYFHGDNFYYKGTEDDTFDDAHAIKLIEGSGDAVKVRVIYDFKTDRLLAAYLPSGNIDEQMAINADVMFIREHQGDIDQLTFSEKDSKMGAITNIETAYAVMRFNKWTLNNKEKTGSHNPLASPASIYERSLYYVSFPFPVNLSEVFGFGTYGQHWIIQRYRGDLRAQQGFWAESDGFWEFIWNRNGVVLQPNEGYILTLETELLGEESDVWGPDQRSNQIELFFPSTGPLGSITNESVTQTLPAHTCTIDKTKDQFGNLTGLQDSPDPSKSYNRTIFDSHWNIMSVPTYVNVDDPNFVNTTWIGGEKGNVGPKFLYTWNMDDNTLTATSGKGFMYHAMHAYTVQYHGEVTWTTSVTPTAAPQRNTEYRGEYEFCLEVQQDEQMIDRTFVRLSDDENVTTGFEFGEDMTKQFNSRKANIFTIAGNTSLGGNSLPISTTQTTVVPVGVKIKTAGDYTFSIPEGTDGIGVTLVDNETGVRTLLSALDYTVNLTAGTHDQRFILEISPIYNTPTGIEEPTSDSSLKGRAQKRIIDGVLYIVKDGKIFDARGTRVE